MDRRLIAGRRILHRRSIDIISMLIVLLLMQVEAGASLTSSFHRSGVFFIHRHAMLPVGVRFILPILNQSAKNGKVTLFSLNSQHQCDAAIRLGHRQNWRRFHCGRSRRDQMIAFSHSGCCSSEIRMSSLWMSQSSSSYYKMATSAAVAASSSRVSAATSITAKSSSSLSSNSLEATSSLSFPDWWPSPSSTSDDDSAVNLPNKYIKFADHVAHLVIPEGNVISTPTGEDQVIKISSNPSDGCVANISDDDDENENAAQPSLAYITTVDEAIRYVLECASIRTRNSVINNPQSSTDIGSDSITCGSNVVSTCALLDNEYYRRRRIEEEWKEGEDGSATRNLEPAYRHDPTLLPQQQISPSPNDRINLIASELLALGSIWYHPVHRHQSSSSSASVGYDRFDPSNGSKPTRLTVGDMNRTIQPGDYFRVHFDPRRFVDANLYDWGRKTAAASDMDGENLEVEIMTAAIDGRDGTGRPGVIVRRDDAAGYIIIDKPANIPVHARVDNLLENVASCVGRMLWKERQNSLILINEDDDEEEEMNTATTVCVDITAPDENSTSLELGRSKRRARRQQKQKIDPLIYVATPQRLDQNTSGLLVVATKKSFASYFAKLLRIKTSRTLRHGGASSGGVHKSYRCLVCIFAPGYETSNDVLDIESIIANKVDRLKRYTIMRHFLEPSIRAPKRFVSSVPDDAANAGAYVECLLRITNLSEAFVVAGNNGRSRALSKSLWGDHGMPDDCVAVVECEIELLTGRTHQIRGQLAAEGFPLVGDVQYGGAVPTTSSIWKERCKGRVESFLDSERLALQCCSLEFLDPQLLSENDGLDQGKRSEEWLSFRLDSAFWSPFLQKSKRDMTMD